MSSAAPGPLSIRLPWGYGRSNRQFLVTKAAQLLRGAYTRKSAAPPKQKAVLARTEGTQSLTLSGLEGPSEARRRRARRGADASAAPKRG